MGVHKGLMAATLAVAAAVVGIAALVMASANDSSSSSSGNRSASPDVILDGSSTPDLAPSIGTNEALGGKQLARVDVETLDGDAVDTGSLIGKPMVINVWYAGCVPCKKELPVFAKLQGEYGDRVRFVGIDSLGPSPSEEQFARGKGVQYELFYDSDGAFVSAMGISTQPVTMFVRPDGSIAAQAGEVTEDSLRAMIETNVG
jgi:thiol-disulfide isomerase/thioredoxin